jgi:murein DD-endopeptidase MepM/ murein hydrolase activator NlpD
MDTAWEPFLQTVFDYMDQPVDNLSISPLIRARVAAEFELDVDQRRPQGTSTELEQLVTDLLTHIDYRMRKLRSLTGNRVRRAISLAQDGKLSWPLSFGLVTSGYGSRKDPLKPGRIQFHEGLDLATPPHEPVYAAAGGTVVFAGWSGGYGRMVRIHHNEHQETVYGHLAATLVQLDQELSRGQIVGLVGRTGRATGHHLHFGVYVDGKAVDPMEHLVSIPMSFSDTTPGAVFGHPGNP